jgi:hypothetical protein
MLALEVRCIRRIDPVEPSAHQGVPKLSAPAARSATIPQCLAETHVAGTQRATELGTVCKIN